MHLEKQLSPNKKSDTVVLLVHGAFQGAWIWEDNFIPFFAAQGLDTYAIDLTKGDASQKTWRISLEDLVQDLRKAIEYIGQPVILIGHSMGSIIIQRYLEHHIAEAAVLLCGIPPYGMCKNIGKVMAKTPGNFLKFAGLFVLPPKTFSNLGKGPTGIYAPHFPPEIARQHLNKMHSEPKRLLLQLSKQKIDANAVKRTRLKIIGAEDDGLILKDEVIATAKYYDVPYTLYDNVGHSLMFAPNWEEIAQDILDWL